MGAPSVSFNKLAATGAIVVVIVVSVRTEVAVAVVGIGILDLAGNRHLQGLASRGP